MSKFKPQKAFSKLEKTDDDVIFSGLGLGLERCPSRSRSQSRERCRSWSRKNFVVSVLFSDELVSTTTLPEGLEVKPQLLGDFCDFSKK